ncbi:MAG: transposase [Ardenticatenales bacterium]|nr:transposase [Ardenticatenales bacterium]
MIVTEGNGLPIGLHVASATPHEMTMVEATLSSIRVPRPGRGRPRSRVAELIADKAYDSRPFRQSLRHRGSSRPSR